MSRKARACGTPTRVGGQVEVLELLAAPLQLARQVALGVHLRGPRPRGEHLEGGVIGG